MNDDWRLRINLHGQGLARLLGERLDATTIEHQLETSFKDRVIVSTDGSEVFCYAGTRAQAEAAERAIRALAAEHDWQLDAELTRWHPQSGEWEDPDVPMPDSDAERDAEHAELIRREREESERQGFPSFEVRVQCASESDCEAFAGRLQDEGLRVVRRSRYLVIGAADEDMARELAARVHREAPDGSAVVAEGTVPAVMSVSGGNPFAVFGGLAG
jgi:hypothetical protein